jgi:hypothetical protein
VYLFEKGCEKEQEGQGYHGKWLYYYFDEHVESGRYKYCQRQCGFAQWC